MTPRRRHLPLGRVTSGGHGSSPPYATIDCVSGNCCRRHLIFEMRELMMRLVISISAAIISAIAAYVSVSAQEHADIDAGAAELNRHFAAEVEEQKRRMKKYLAKTVRDVVILGMLFFVMILSPTWLAHVFCIFIAIYIVYYAITNLLEMWINLPNILMFMTELWLHKFNPHSAIDALIERKIHYMVKIKVDDNLAKLDFLKSAMHGIFGSSSSSITSEIIRRSNYNVLKKVLRNSILLFLFCLVFLILIGLVLRSLSWSEYGCW